MPRQWRNVVSTRSRVDAIRTGVERLARRSQGPRHHGNPYISRATDLLEPRGLAHRVRRVAHARNSARRDEDSRYGPLSDLEGFTVAIKDNIVTTDLPTTCASNILRGFAAPAPATVTRLLEDAGMQVVAKANMDEFGMGSHSINSAFGPVQNGFGRDAALSVGGSSGGSAAAVAWNLAHVGIGTDTGGSIRLPAAYTSLMGFKPSYGRISRAGVVPYANSLDTVGIVGKRIDDVVQTYKVLDQPDDLDPTCLTLATRQRIKDAKMERAAAMSSENGEPASAGKDYDFIPYDLDIGMDERGETSFLGRQMITTYQDAVHEDGYPIQEELKSPRYLSHRDRKKMRPQTASYHRRIGVPVEYNIAELHPLVRWSWVATLSHLAANGHEIVPIALPSTKHALSAYYILAPAEASSNLAKYDGVRYGGPRENIFDDEDGKLYAKHRGENFGNEVKRRILLGSYSLSAGAMENYFIQAQKVRRLVQNDFDAVFRMRNPLHDDSAYNPDGVDLIVCPTAPTPPPHLRYVKHASPVESYMNDVFTVPASLAGLPALSVPGPAHPENPWSPENFVGIQVLGQYGDDDSVLWFSKNMLERFHDHENVERRVQSKKVR